MYEQIPTIIRQRLAGVFDATGGIGSAIAPFVAEWHYGRVVISVICLATSQLLWFLPSTLGRPLADTCEDAENMGKKEYTAVK